MRYSLLLVLTLGACASSPTTVDTKAEAIGDASIVATKNGRLAARLVSPVHDAKHHQATSKVFHHVYAPDGRLLTKGPGGQFGHHRGLFLGWNQLSSGRERYDFWHCNRGEIQQHEGFIDHGEHGLGEDWQVSAINWLTPDGRALIAERRAIRARELGELTVLDLCSELRAFADVRLAGDPQHAGQQFRALQMFAEQNGPKVDYIRPLAAAGKGNDIWTGCEWIAAVLPMPDREVTVLRIEGRDNPLPTTWSTRAYGRFGATFTHRLRKGNVLKLSWTYVIANGRRDRDWCQRTVAAINP